MNKLNPDNINFENSDFLIDIEKNEKNEKNIQTIKLQKALKEANDEANNIIQEAIKKADDIIKKAKEDIEIQKENILKNAQNEADAILKKANDDIEIQKENIEKERIEQAKLGYDEGHADGIIKAKEELLDELEKEYNDKLSMLNNFTNLELNIKDKILKSLTNEIISIIETISRKIILKSIDPETIENIIKETIKLIEKKENINITLSENYAKNLYELQKRKLKDEIDFDFNQFNQFENLKISYSPKFKEDTIIVENLIERFDASISSQLDIIINNIKNNNQIIKENLENDFRKSE